ncbi:nuclease-related domain-containing protein [Bacillus sp. JJ1566]|uniref:nuclease-related domain-containing protein n=1 Tax=Bacillus sp. JJ1566 TaxID=3122961 RepID=UPI002FFDBA8C
MLFKARNKSGELITLEILNKRSDLSSKDKQYFLNLKKGYEGELLFDSLTEKLQCECLILNDLLLEVNNTTFQIDSSIFIDGKIHSYEVKNFEGDYYYESNKLLKITTNVVYDWCQGNPTKRKLQKILTSNFKSVGVHQWTYYEKN